MKGLFMENLITWIRDHDTTLWWLASGSVIMFVGGLILVPLLVVRIPHDYFAHEERPPAPWSNQHWFVQILLLVVKNILGVILLLLGIAMLLLPGQGLLSILMGIMLLNFPGKFQLERWFVRRPAVLRSINWLRGKANQDPLLLP